MVLLILILVIALICGVFGFVVKGLLWLALIALLVIVVAAVLGGINYRGRNRP